MNFLSAENLSKSFGERILFKDITLGLERGDKMAMVAANGAGKTSILRILAGKDSPDDGKVAIRKGIRIGFLEQEPVIDSDVSVSEFVRSAGSEVLSVIREYNEALDGQTAEHSPEKNIALELATAKMDHFHAWDYDRRMVQILDRFNITDLEQKVDTLSGGQKKRLALALLLLDSPELLLLDEPTNHLDINMIEWLEKYLQQANITFLIVTHDRYFLDRVCNKILEMSNGRLFIHEGNYSYFLEKQAQREIAENTEIEKAGKLMKSELEWMRRMPKARTSKSKSRIDAFYQTKEKANSGKKVSELKLDIKMNRMGGKILELKNLSKSYGNIRILNNFNYSFLRGERIGIIGKNGVGKSSFLNLITGNEITDSGSIDSGETIVFGFYKQDGITLNEDKRVIDVVKDIAEIIMLNDGKSLSASQFLQHFMFPPEMQYSYVSKLSGGERRRLYLLTILIKNPNFLILDEPTNDLDIITLNKLEDFLSDFGGCLILATHDRYFLDKLVDHIFIFEGDGKISDFTGTYSDYRLSAEALESEEKPVSSASKPEKNQMIRESQKEKKKHSFKEKQEFEKLGLEIAGLESEKADLENILNSGENDYSKLQQISGRIAEIINLLDEKVMRWLELDEITS
jgi:ABC transport system ATP-binding/permease protein